MWTRPLPYAILPFIAALAVSCNDSGNTTIINQGLDCQLVRANLLGDWVVNLATATPSLQVCTGLDPGLNGSVVGTNNFPATYSNVGVFGSDGSTSFKILADRSDAGADSSQTVELTGSVQADSCLGIVRVWDKTDALYFQCIGAFTISNKTLSGACDSAEIDTDLDGQLDTSCSLSNGVTFDAGIK